jgi:hypothetical protein
LIAHRGGNSVMALASVPVGTNCVEFDVHRHRGRLVVRHAKRLWGTSRLWERWYLLPPDTEVSDLSPLLARAAGAGHGLWVDAKGVSPALAAAVLADYDELPGAGAGGSPGFPGLTISTKSWWILSRIPAHRRMLQGPCPPPVRVIRSAGNRLELVLLRFWPSSVGLDGVAVHRRLLNRARVERLRGRHRRVFCWSVPDLVTARRLLHWGVDGLIVDDRDLLRALAAPSQQT